MPASLQLADFSDRDLFYALERAGDAAGWASAEEIREQIGLTYEGASQSVAVRLGWMNRYGFMERDEEAVPALWRLNEIGREVFHPAKLPVAVERALDGLEDGQRAQVTEALAQQMPSSSRQAMHYARRSVKHHWGRWRDPIANKRRQTKR